jgi:hypothetical protein
MRRNPRVLTPTSLLSRLVPALVASMWGRPVACGGLSGRTLAELRGPRSLRGFPTKAVKSHPGQVTSVRDILSGGVLPHRGAGLIMAALLCLSSANAAVIYSNFGPAPGYSTSADFITGANPDEPPGDSYNIASSQAIAESFVASGTYLLGDIQLALGLWAGADSVTVDLDADAGGSPGTVLESWNVTGLTAYDWPTGSAQGSILTEPSLLHPQLISGDTYWVAVAAGTSNTAAAWLEIDSGLQYEAPHDVNYDASVSGPWTAFAYCCSTAVEVDSFTAAGVPEPNSTYLALAALALVLLRMTAGRRNKLRREERNEC